jgi:hypothetical protein
MAVGLQVMISENEPMPFWDKFLDAQESDELKSIEAVLKEFGGWTDWDSWSDPVWFPDEESLTAFVLTWS